MDSDDPEDKGRRVRGPRRAPVSRSGRLRPAPRRKPVGAGAPRRAGSPAVPRPRKRKIPGPAAGPGRTGRRPGGAGPKLYFGAAGALGAVVILVLAAVVLLRGGDGPKPGDVPAAALGPAAGNGPSPVSYSSSPSSAVYAGIADRRADAAPLTEGEAFPSSAGTVTVPGGVKVTLRAKRLEADCSAAVWGATVAADLRRGGCTQAVRGVYSGTGRGYGLAVAVFNLAAAADAGRFVETLDRTRGGGFVRPLEAPGPLASFGRGFGMARGLAQGHYAVIAWAQRLDGSGDEKDETLLSLLIEGGKAPAVLGRAARAGN